MSAPLKIIRYSAEYHSAIRIILEPVGWAEQYIRSAEQTAEQFSQDDTFYGAYLALLDGEISGFIYIQHYAWNQLAQIHGLAVKPSCQRQGVATALVEAAHTFARDRQARGCYVDTPVPNLGGRKFYEAIGYKLAYIMPRYYEDALDGVTYQIFFDTA